MDIISRKRASQQGLLTYFTGKPCKQGHIAPHWVSSYQCVECDKARAGAKGQLRWRKQRENIRREKQAYKERHADRIKAADRVWRDKNRDKCAATTARYRAAKLQATPAWADHLHIDTIYHECFNITSTTGVPHEVDHYYPLQGDAVCGLHVGSNLRIITLSENRAKRNTHPEQD